MGNSTEAEVKSFLLSVKYAIQNGTEREPGWLLRMRPKNLSSIAQLGIFLADVGSEVQSLSVLDYCDGPSKDRDIAGDVWTFGKVVAGKEVYIKLKLGGDKRYSQVIVLSFHPARYPLSYPFK